MFAVINSWTSGEGLCLTKNTGPNASSLITHTGRENRPSCQPLQRGSVSVSVSSCLSLPVPSSAFPSAPVSVCLLLSLPISLCLLLVSFPVSASRLFFLLVPFISLSLSPRVCFALLWLLIYCLKNASSFLCRFIIIFYLWDVEYSQMMPP